MTSKKFPVRLPAASGLLLLLAACATPVPPVATAPAPAPAVKAASAESLTIDFAPAGAGLSPTAAAQLDGAARLYRDAQPEVMIVAGHTDKVGAEFPNLVLSARRADMVKQALVQRGVPPERLQIVAIGAAEPTGAPTASRSVVVTWR